MRLNKKKKSTNTSPYPDEVIDRLARAFYPAILACWNSEEGQREFAAWQAEQAHLSGKEKQEVPAGELPVVHIVIVCGLWQGASYSGTHPVFVLSLHRLFELQHSAS
ncbi:transposase [Faecalibacterium sp. HTF-128]|uniref:Transposase n=1 Tax=Faecalibacterium wellingii TaxID=2929491 RepID=A0AB35Y591_9FIRM